MTLCKSCTRAGLGTCQSPGMCNLLSDGKKPLWWTVWQDDLPVAGTDSWEQAKHYAAVYAQDGPVELREGTRRTRRLRVRINLGEQT